MKGTDKSGATSVRQPALIGTKEPEDAVVKTEVTVVGKTVGTTVVIVVKPPLPSVNVCVCVIEVEIVDTTVLVTVVVTVSWVPDNVLVGAAGCENPVVSENPGPRKGCSGGGEDG